jgi:hypothetical protein
VCTKDSYICSLHFVGENGPTLECTDPISAVKSAENVSVNRILFEYLKKSSTRVKYVNTKTYLIYIITKACHLKYGGLLNVSF